ncbi:MAG: RidA family protein [Treponema sp.]|jgi:enamine deaminase RidA (YjgF/YER057c/UK114 family)|nr:RidA family protein [Treponema sp.]
MDVYARMKELGISLPPPPAKGGLYAPVKRFGGNLVYVSGCGPEKPVQGKLGREISLEEGQRQARSCMLNVLAVLEANVEGGLGRVKNCVKVLSFVASTDDFYDQPAVANGGTGLLIDLFGPEAGAPARAAIGVNALPGNMPVETEALFELDL